jgi:hypothetical protein
MNLADISNKDAESFINGAKELIATVFNAVVDFIDFLPPIVLGGIVVVLSIIFLYHKAKS